MIELSAKTYGNAAQLSSMIDGAARLADDISPALPAVAARFHKQMERHFDQRGAAGPSGAWAPLSLDYAAWKAKKYPGKGILEATGAMRDALTSFGEGSYTLYGPNSVFIGSTLDYPTYHQTGTERMPQRVVIDPSDRDAAEWVVEIWRWYEAQTSKLGWKGRFAGAMAGV